MLCVYRKLKVVTHHSWLFHLFLSYNRSVIKDLLFKKCDFVSEDHEVIIFIQVLQLSTQGSFYAVSFNEDFLKNENMLPSL